MDLSRGSAWGHSRGLTDTLTRPSDTSPPSPPNLPTLAVRCPGAPAPKTPTGHVPPGTVRPPRETPKGGAVVGSADVRSERW